MLPSIFSQCIHCLPLQVKLPPIMLVPHMGTDLNHSCITFNPAPCYCAQQSSKEWFKCLNPCHPHGKTQKKLLVSGWPISCHCSHLDSHPAYRRLSSFSLHLSATMPFEHKHLKEIKWKICMLLYISTRIYLKWKCVSSTDTFWHTDSQISKG